MTLSPQAAKARRKRMQASSIDKLDPEIREMIGKLRIDNGWTIDEILAKLRELGNGAEKVSRSALGRHVRDLADVAQQMRDTQIYAEALAKEVGSEDEGRMLSVNAQLLQANMFRLMVAEADGEAVQFGPKDAKALSETLRNLAQTRRTEIDVIEKAEKRAAEKARIAAAAAAEEVGKRAGVSPETLAEINRRIMGVG